jgi:hypothetical protein
LITIKKLTTGLVTAGILAGTLVTPVFAETTVDVSGNGVKSTNTVVLSNTCKSVVKQSNSTEAMTEVGVVTSTGGNQANGNTGGTTSVETGDAATTVAVVVTGGSNEATAPSCCECGEGSVVVDVTGNGKKSTNTVMNTDLKVAKAKQKTKTEALTGVSVLTKTGKNKANWNTGSGTTVKTGGATTDVLVTVDGGSNTLNP